MYKAPKVFIRFEFENDIKQSQISELCDHITLLTRT